MYGCCESTENDNSKIVDPKSNTLQFRAALSVISAQFEIVLDAQAVRHRIGLQIARMEGQVVVREPLTGGKEVESYSSTLRYIYLLSPIGNKSGIYIK